MLPPPWSPPKSAVSAPRSADLCPFTQWRSQAPTQRRLVPAGPAFINYARLKLHHNFDLDTHDKHLETQKQKLEEQNAANGSGEDDLGVGDEPESAELLSLDPKEWKVRRASHPLDISLTLLPETRLLRRPRSLAPPHQRYA